MGGLRDTSIGIDLRVYGVEYFYYALFSNSFSDLIRNSPTSEYGYIILNYICSLLSTEINFFLFISEFIKISLVCIVAVYFKDSLNGAILISGYLLFFYFGGYSLLRQQLALCICLVSLIPLINGNWIKFLLLVFLAWTFHHSAFIMFFLPIVLKLSRKWYSIPLITLFLFLVYQYKVQLLVFLSGSGIVQEVMADRYVDSGVATAKANILIGATFLLYSIFVGDENKARKRLILINSIFCLFFLFMASFFEVAFRVSYYQMIILIAVILMSINRIRSAWFRAFCQFVYLLLFIFYFVVESNHGLSGTIPYTSSILGIR